jgi:predicted GIY-YIG superfamily endonuclease
MAKENCMYRVTWKTKHDEDSEIFFSEAQVKSFIAKWKKAFISYSVEKIYR